MPRIQSPSSINTYKQCPRKYYFRYIEQIPSKPSIHTLRGNAVHEALENFFKTNIEYVNEQNYQFELNTILHDLLRQAWNKRREDFEKIGSNKDELYQYYMESKEMLQNWFTKFMNKLHPLVNEMGLIDAFQKLVPKTEVFYKSDTFKVQGYLDAIYEEETETRIVDYKTSKSNNITNEYRLQLAIYALLYQEGNNGKRPDKVGIHFLKFNEETFLKVTEELIEYAKKECQAIQLNTQSMSMSDYPKNVGPLCKWGGGQCEYFEICFGQISIEEAKEKAKEWKK